MIAKFSVKATLKKQKLIVLIKIISLLSFCPFNLNVHENNNRIIF